MVAIVRQQLKRFWQMSEIVAISNGGERVTHLYPNDCYYAHLSLYRFAVQFAVGKRVLDAGSGTGYGAGYLADQGARRVVGLDISADGIAFSQRHFRRQNLRFMRQDIQTLPGVMPGSIELLICSNVLEHLPNVSTFLHAAHRVLSHNGEMLIAVPPVIHEYSRLENLANPYHINVWSPAQWYSALQHFFADVQCYQHISTRPDIALDFMNRPQETVITEADFAFLPVTLDQWLANPTMTLVILARMPREQTMLPRADEKLPLIDNSVTKAVSSARPARRDVVLQRLKAMMAPPASRRWQLWTIMQRVLLFRRDQGSKVLIGKVVAALRRY